MEDIIGKKLFDHKAIMLFGPRQVGKTTFLKNLITSSGEDYLYFLCDDDVIKSRLEQANTELMRNIIGEAKIVFIDEAQLLENAGRIIKLMVDQFPEAQIIVSGSSSFELKDKMNEPLTGRKWDYLMLPFSFEELKNETNFLAETSQLSHRLIFGSYPDVVNRPSEAPQVLKLLAESYLYKDILQLAPLRQINQLKNLLKALAFQVGSEVSFNELSRKIGIDKNTVSSYLEILEQAFIVFPLTSFSRNLRNEINTKQRIYFYDNGIRNAIIQQYMPLENRQDIGALFENYVISERKKYLNFNDRMVNTYFWRTHSQQEIDYVEEEDGQLNAFEIKYNPFKKVKFPKSFLDAYSPKTKVITSDNYYEILIG